MYATYTRLPNKTFGDLDSLSLVKPLSPILKLLISSNTETNQAPAAEYKTELTHYFRIYII